MRDHVLELKRTIEDRAKRSKVFPNCALMDTEEAGTRERGLT